MLIQLNTLYYHTGDDRPCMKDLNRHIVEQQAAQWERLGLELGLKDYNIANISKDNEHNPNRSTACCRAMLEQWLKKIPSATWGKLDDAIKNIIPPSAINTESSDKRGNHGYCYGILNY